MMWSIVFFAVLAFSVMFYVSSKDTKIIAPILVRRRTPGGMNDEEFEEARSSYAITSKKHGRKAFVGGLVVLFIAYIVVPKSVFKLSFLWFFGIGIPLVFLAQWLVVGRIKDLARVPNVREKLVECLGFATLLNKPKLLISTPAWNVDAPLLAFKDHIADYPDEKELQEIELDEDDLTWGDGRINVYASVEDRALVLGAPGSGKTSLLIAQIVEWMKTGNSLVFTDIKPEIFGILVDSGIFEKYNYDYHVINPTDINSHHYNMFSEIEKESDYNEILSVIIPAQEGDSAVFTDNARRLLKAILMHLGTEANLTAARRFMNDCDDSEELFRKLKASDNDSVADIARDILRMSKNERLLASVQSQLALSLQFLDVSVIRETTSKSDFSLRDVLSKDGQCVVLQYEQSEKNTTATLFGAMIAHVMRILQSNHEQRDAVLVLLDEIINCAPIPKFTETLNLMRSANIPTFLYLQSLEGLNRLYGDNADKLFNGACNLKISYRIFDEATQEYFSNLIGKTEVTYIQETSTFSDSITTSTAPIGATSGGGGRTVGTSKATGKSVKMENIIDPEEFSRLENGEAVIMYDGYFARLHMPMYYNDYPLDRSKIKTMSDLVEVEAVHV